MHEQKLLALARFPKLIFKDIITKFRKIQILGFSNFSLGSASRPIILQIFKTPKLLEVPWNYDP